MRQDATLVGNQGREQAEFRGGQVDPKSSAGDRVGAQVDQYLAELHAGFIPGRGLPAQQRANPRQQFTDAKGLGQVVVGACVERADFLRFGKARRQHQHGRAGPASEVRDERNAIAVGQAEIEEHEIGWMLARGRQSGGALASLVHHHALRD